MMDNKIVIKAVFHNQITGFAWGYENINDGGTVISLEEAKVFAMQLSQNKGLMLLTASGDNSFDYYDAAEGSVAIELMCKSAYGLYIVRLSDAIACLEYIFKGACGKDIEDFLEYAVCQASNLDS